MTTPVLSPAEHDEAVRFGIHDLDVLAGMEEHADDVPQCINGDHPAQARLVATCCGIQAIACTLHIQEHMLWIDKVLLSLQVVRCAGCHAEFRLPSMSDDVCRVVAL